MLLPTAYTLDEASDIVRELLVDNTEIWPATEPW